ncbi:hypothetical protein, partial [Treponema sp. R6D11]
MDQDCLQTLFSGLSLIIAFFAFLLACIIPNRIMINQLYTGLIAEYRTHEMGLAILCHRFLQNFYTNYIYDDSLNLHFYHIKAPHLFQYSYKSY